VIFCWRISGIAHDSADHGATEAAGYWAVGGRAQGGRPAAWKGRQLRRPYLLSAMLISAAININAKATIIPVLKRVTQKRTADSFPRGIFGGKI
jgi:hypothetical protein